MGKGLEACFDRTEGPPLARSLDPDLTIITMSALAGLACAGMSGGFCTKLPYHQSGNERSFLRAACPIPRSSPRKREPRAATHSGSLNCAHHFGRNCGFTFGEQLILQDSVTQSISSPVRAAPGGAAALAAGDIGGGADWDICGVACSLAGAAGLSGAFC